MTIKHYYQCTDTGDDIIPVYATVGSTNIPTGVYQLVVNSFLQPGIKKFDTITKEVIFYKTTYDENGEVTGIEEDLTISRVTIPDADIIEG